MIPGSRGVPLAAVEPISPPAEEQLPESQACLDGDLAIPDDFTSRIRRLPSDTQVHIPAQLRNRIATFTTTCLEGMAAALPGWTALEEGRSKLLLSCIPYGAHVPTEIATRTALAERRAFGTLLNRIEMHAALKRQSGHRKKRRKRCNESESIDDTRREIALEQVREGAYRKSITTLSAASERYTICEEREWTTALHPAPVDPEAALFTGDIGNGLMPDENSRDEPDYPLKGVRFSSLKAPGPSGTRAEHFSELLGARKRIANKLLRALGKVLNLIECGGLCPEARWIARTRTFNIPINRVTSRGTSNQASSSEHLLRDE